MTGPEHLRPHGSPSPAERTPIPSASANPSVSIQPPPLTSSKPPASLEPAATDSTHVPAGLPQPVRMGDTGGPGATTEPPPAGWHRDPSNPNSALRWWDGSGWTDHVHQLAAPSFSRAGPAAHNPAGGLRPQPSWAGQKGLTGSRVRGANQVSLTAIGFAALYVLTAMTTHFVFIGIVPVMASIHAFRRRERLAPLAAVAAAAALVVSISTLT
jgi:hypothetical protein